MKIKELLAIAEAEYSKTGKIFKGPTEEDHVHKTKVMDEHRSKLKELRTKQKDAEDSGDNDKYDELEGHIKLRKARMMGDSAHLKGKDRNDK